MKRDVLKRAWQIFRNVVALYDNLNYSDCLKISWEIEKSGYILKESDTQSYSTNNEYIGVNDLYVSTIDNCFDMALIELL